MSTAAVDDLLASMGPPTDPTAPYVGNDGQYHAIHPDTGKPARFQRASRFAQAIEDGYMLELYKMRMVLMGAAMRPDITAQAIAAGEADKDRLNELAVAASEAAGGTKAANLGTAMHDIIEQVNRGEHVPMTPEIQADVDAYLAALDAHGITVLPDLMERIVCCPELGVIGRFDNIYRVDGSDYRIEGWDQDLIGDTKTGGFLAWGNFAVQLGIYARAPWMWEPGTPGRWVQKPVVDLERALVVHVPVGQARCDLYTVDIAAGWEACDLVRRVKAWRNRRDLGTPLAPAGTAPAAGSEGGEAAPGASEAPVEPPASAVYSSTLYASAIDEANAILRDRFRAAVALLPDAPPYGRVLPPGINWPAKVRRFADGGPRTVEGVRLVESFVQRLEIETGAPFGPSLPPLGDEIVPEEVPPVEVAPVVTLAERRQQAAARAEEMFDTWGWGDPEKRVLILAATGGVPVNPPDLADRHLDALQELMIALDTGRIEMRYLDGEPFLAVPAATQLDLVKHHGNKTELLKAAKEAAKRLGRPVPTSSKAAMADFVLVAALAAEMGGG